MIHPPRTLSLPRPVAFAFSGGSSLGAIQVGMLRALQERGVTPDLLVGSSAGAINAAFAGGGIDAERIAELADIWSRVRASDVFGAPGIKRILAIFERGSLAAPTGLQALLERNLPARHADLVIPTAIVATELLSGAPVILEDGDLRQNVLASAAIPGLFPAVEIGGRALADGGLAAQVPILEALALGAASVVVLDASYPCALTELPRGLVPNVVHAAGLVLRHQSQNALRSVGKDATIVYLPSPCPLGVAPWDFSQWDALIGRGYRFASWFLADLASVGPGIHGHPHFHASEEPVRAPSAAVAGVGLGGGAGHH